MTAPLTFAEAHQGYLNIARAQKMWDDIVPVDTAPMTDAVAHMAGDDAFYNAVFDALIVALTAPTSSAAELATKCSLIDEFTVQNMVDWPTVLACIISDALRLGEQS